MTDLVFQMTAALGFVVLLIYGLGILYRRRGRGNAMIRLVEYQSLGRNFGVAAVKIGRETLVLGLTPTDFKILQRIRSGDGGSGKQPEAGQDLPASENMASRIDELRKMNEELDG